MCVDVASRMLVCMNLAHTRPNKNVVMASRRLETPVCVTWSLLQRVGHCYRGWVADTEGGQSSGAV